MLLMLQLCKYIQQHGLRLARRILDMNLLQIIFVVKLVRETSVVVSTALSDKMALLTIDAIEVLDYKV